MTPFELFRQVGLLVGLPIAILAGAGAVLVVVPRDWRAVLFGYALTSVMLSLLLSRVLPGEWALLQTIVGGLVAVMLFLSAGELRAVPHDLPRSAQARWPQMASLTSFRVIAAILAAAAYFILHDRVKLPLVEPLFRDALVWLVMMGVLGLALHVEPLHAGLSLLVLIGGIELLLFTLVQSRTLMGLVMAWQLLLGLAIAYLMISRGLTVLMPDAVALQEAMTPEVFAAPQTAASPAATGASGVAVTAPEAPPITEPEAVTP
jgi:hypothetical protein